MRGKALVQNPKGHFVTPSIALFESLTPDQMRKSVSLQTEILSPHVSIIGFETEEELKSITSAMTHGKLATLWTKDLARAERVAQTLVVGEVILNESAFKQNPWSTHQSRKRSGNHAYQGKGLISQLVFPKNIHS